MIRDEVLKSLDRLAEDCEIPWDVARKLERRKITGWRGQPSMCPLAVYLRRTVADWDGLVIKTRALMSRTDFARDDFVDLPDVLVSFVMRFDNGGFPKLEAQRAGC